jgi:uncharacterized protein (TIGR00375 family)
MNFPNMYLWGRKKGINILTAADFTHPLWFREASQNLEEIQDGIYTLKQAANFQKANPQFFAREFYGPYFMLSTEVSAIYSENGVGHRIHNLIFAPNLEVAAKINTAFQKKGFNLSSDGRPIFNLSARNLMELLMEIDPMIALIPCHIWTPWFSLYGSRSGYDAIGDCFGSYAKYVFAIETGLSSDPSMNWRIKELNSRSIVSFSDAHSLEKMGREATVLRWKNGISNTTNVKYPISNENKKEDITYRNILNAFVRGKERTFEIAYTIEFYPEEGKYHFTGHRNCGVSYDPEQDRKLGTTCPKCGRELTVGVMHRVEELADFEEKNYEFEKDENGVTWVKDPTGVRPPYVSLVPLLEILKEALNSGLTSQKVIAEFDKLVTHFGTEHEVLFRVHKDELVKVTSEKIVEAIYKVRDRSINIKPGFDGEYGIVSIWDERSESMPPAGLF